MSRLSLLRSGADHRRGVWKGSGSPPFARALPPCGSNPVRQIDLGDVSLGQAAWRPAVAKRKVERNHARPGYRNRSPDAGGCATFRNGMRELRENATRKLPRPRTGNRPPSKAAALSSSPGSRRARPGICTWGMSARRSKAGGRRAPPAAGFCCGSKTSTTPAAAPNMPRRSSKTWPGSGSNGTARCAGNPSILPITAPPSTRLEAQGLLYPCFCTRREIQAEIAARRRGAAREIGRALSRHLPPPRSRPNAPKGWPAARDYALRLDVGAALARTGPLFWCEDGRAYRGRTGRARRCRAGAQGDADQLSPRGHGRRRAARA